MNTHFRERDNYVRITELTPELKRKIEDAVENLLMILDVYDGDENAEDDGSDEPVNGWPNQGQFSNNAMSCDDEREQDNDDLEQNGDEDEPACGWTEAFDQSCKDRIANTGPQEWSYHYGFDRSGVGKARALLRGRRGRHKNMHLQSF